MKPYYHDEKAGITIYHGKAEDVLPTLERGSVSLVVCDGPYAMKKAAWDMMPMAELGAWYRPHIEAWNTVCAPSATVYLWGSAESWAAIHPEAQAAGWTFRGLITWHKTNAQSQATDKEAARMWPDVTEVCGMYQREGFPRELRLARSVGATTLSHVARACGCDSRLPALWEGYPSVHGSCAPTREQWNKAMSACGLHEMQREEVWAKYRPTHFELPPGVTNVWPHPIVAGAERLKGSAGALHPCQKPLSFARRMIAASSRPGDTALDVFMGSGGVLVAAKELGRRAIGIDSDEKSCAMTAERLAQEVLF